MSNKGSVSIFHIVIFVLVELCPKTIHVKQDSSSSINHPLHLVFMSLRMGNWDHCYCWKTALTKMSLSHPWTRLLVLCASLSVSLDNFKKVRWACMSPLCYSMYSSHTTAKLCKEPLGYSFKSWCHTIQALAPLLCSYDWLCDTCGSCIAIFPTQSCSLSKGSCAA